MPNFFVLDDYSLHNWVNDNVRAEDHNSDSEFDPSEHSDDDISMSDDSDDGDNIPIDSDDSMDDVIPIEILNREDINDNNVDGEEEDDDEAETEEEDDEEEGEEEEEEEEDEVVAAFIAASSEKNRNHPPNLSVGNVLIGGISFHPNTNVLALGLSNGDISMYAHFFSPLKTKLT